MQTLNTAIAIIIAIYGIILIGRSAIHYRSIERLIGYAGGISLLMFGIALWIVVGIS